MNSELREINQFVRCIAKKTQPIADIFSNQVELLKRIVKIAESININLIGRKINFVAPSGETKWFAIERIHNTDKLCFTISNKKDQLSYTTLASFDFKQRIQHFTPINDIIKYIIAHIEGQTRDVIKAVEDE